MVAAVEELTVLVHLDVEVSEVVEMDLFLFQETEGIILVVAVAVDLLLNQADQEVAVVV